MEGPRIVVVLILLFFLWSSPDRRVVSFDDESEGLRLSGRKNDTFDSLAHSSYGDLLNPGVGLNLTGLRPSDGYHWEVLPETLNLARGQRLENWAGHDQNAAIYRTIDAEIRGEYRLTPRTSLDTNKTVNLTTIDSGAEYLSDSYDRNVTDSTGTLVLDLEGVPSNRPPTKSPERLLNYQLREVRAAATITGSQNASSSASNVMLRGLHDPNTGLIILTTWSRKFNALPALPHLLADQSLFVNATTLINETLTGIWSAPQTPSDAFIAAPFCELVIWLTPKPLLSSQIYIDQVERELRYPEGAPIGQPPLLAYSAVVLSPDCGYLLTARTLSGPKVEVWTALLRRVLLALVLILAAQVVLLRHQIRLTSTPSTRARVSYHTIAVSAMGNGMILFAMIYTVSWISSVYLLSGIAALLAVLLMAVLELKLMLDCWTVQVAEPAERDRERQRREGLSNAEVNRVEIAAQPPPDTDTNTNTAATPVSAPALSAAGLPIPATATAPAQITPIQTDPRTTFSTLYTQFYLSLLFLTFTALWSLTFPPTLQKVYTALLLTAYYSLLLPQIYHNTLRNTRKPLTYTFLLGSSALRLLPTLYLLIHPHNILSTRPRPRLALFLTLWTIAQLTLLAAQDLLGPRFGLPTSWFPAVYDYHPIISTSPSTSESEPQLESSHLLSLPNSFQTDQDKTHDTDRDKISDTCTICMNEVTVPLLTTTTNTATTTSILIHSIVERRKYMITPCRHIFHTRCLQDWMDLRLVCPVCREVLPAI